MLKRWVGRTLLCGLPVLWGTSVSDEGGGYEGLSSTEMAHKTFFFNLILLCMTPCIVEMKIFAPIMSLPEP